MIKKLLLINMSLMFSVTNTMLMLKRSLEDLPLENVAIQEINTKSPGVCVQRQTDSDGVSAVIIRRKKSFSMTQGHWQRVLEEQKIDSNDKSTHQQPSLSPEELTQTLKALKEGSNLIILNATKQVLNGRSVLLVNAQISLEQD